MDSKHHINDQVHFTVGKPSRERLSFCAVNEAAIADWIAHLPLTSVGTSARQVFNALTELNQLVTTAAVRLALLELLRPPTQQLSMLLERHFSNQPLQLRNAALETARLAQAMQALLWRGYRQVLVDADNEGLLTPGRSAAVPALVVSAIARAIAAQSEILLRSSQLYAPTPAGFWQALHQLHLLAERLDCTAVEVPDPLLQQRSGLSIEAAYLRVLLFDIAQPQQMRQQSCLPLYRALELWSREARLLPLQQTPASHHFRVDLQSDLPAIYTDHERPITPGTWRLLDLKPILERLEQIAATPTDQPGPIERELVDQLFVSWGARATRRFQRIESHEQVEIIIGLPSIHFHCANRLDFSEWLNRLLPLLELTQLPPEKGSPFAAPSADVWDGAFDAREKFNPLIHLPLPPVLEFTRPVTAAAEQTLPHQPSYPIHQVQVANSSVNGYRLRWHQSIPERIQNGTLLGIRTEPSLPWSIATVRWTQLDERSQAHVGVELLGPNATACAVRLEGKRGEVTEFMRGLLLPTLPTTGQAASLLLFCKPFRSKDKVTLIQPGQRNSIKLVRQLRKNHTFAQFEFLALQACARTENTEKIERNLPTPASGFDQLWQIL